MDIENKKQLLICKACGYKIKAGNLKIVCPACGVAKKFFEPFTDNISPKRRFILELHAHPIIVHFPVGIPIFFFFVILVSIFTGGKVSAALYGTATVASIVLPFFVIGGFLSGIIDGIARFKKIKRPMLLTKIYLSLCFFIFSVAILIIIQVFGFGALYIKIILLVLGLFTAICGALLGKLGGYLVDAILPGK